MRYRLPLLALGGAALLAGMWAGLLRLGWALPTVRAGLPADHGPLMVSGFLGTLISLERAVALAADRRWPYLAPLLAGLGSAVLVLGLPWPIGPALMAAGSLAMLAMFVVIVRAQPALHTATMAAGAAAWLVGNVLWLAGAPFAVVAPLWIGFLVFTIAGERLELSRVQRLSVWALRLFAAACALLAATLLHVTFAGLRGAWLGPFGLGLLGVAAWLLRYDVARRTVRRAGLIRYTAAGLLTGYVWLGVSGVFWLLWGGRQLAGPLYDAQLHSVLLGFVMAMVFAHAPIIMPAILSAPFRFRSALYAPVVALHLGLLARIAGDLSGSSPLRSWGGLLNVLAVMLFVALIAWSRPGAAAEV